MNKVFGIGLSKTATTSLNDALIHLGYDGVHFPFMSYKWGQLVLDSECIRTNDAFTDTPVANCFKYLDREYPNSKFIYTTRNEEDWLRSCAAHFRDWDMGLKDAVEHFKWVHLQYSLYGTLSFDRESYRSAYRKHDRSVRKYFADRDDDLLILNICGGEGWGKLCDFLGHPEPSIPFPKSNVTEEKAQP